MCLGVVRGFAGNLKLIQTLQEYLSQVRRFLQQETSLKLSQRAHTSSKLSQGAHTSFKLSQGAHMSFKLSQGAHTSFKLSQVRRFKLRLRMRNFAAVNIVKQICNG
jgi:hypothetical protein